MGKGRPRKLGKRKPCGRLRKVNDDDRRFDNVAHEHRMRNFHLTQSISVNPLAGYLAGVMYLKGKIEALHLGHFFSFLQVIPKNGVRAIPMNERVQGGRAKGFVYNKRYSRLAKHLGKKINALHELAHDRLVVPVNTLKAVLEQVPLTREGSWFMNWCENHHPRNTAKR